MRILFLGDCISTQKTGIHYFGRQLVHRIVKAMPGHEFQILLSKRIEEFEFEQIVFPVRTWIPFHLRIRQLTSIPRYIIRSMPDVVIELAHFGPFFLPGSIKQITVVHDLTPIKYPKFHDRMSVFMHKLILSGTLRKSDYLIVNSYNTKKDIIDSYKINEEKIKVIYPFLVEPVDRIKSSEIPGHLDISKPYFLTVGTIEPRKDHLTILKAFEKLCEIDDEFLLVIAGKLGWQYQSFLGHLKKSKFKDRVIITGYISRKLLWFLYEKAFAFVFASVYEGFGLPVLEAQSFSLPLILSKNPAVSEIAEHNALYFDPQDYRSLFTHMKNLIGNNSMHSKYSKKANSRYHFFKSQEYTFDFIAQ